MFLIVSLARKLYSRTVRFSFLPGAWHSIMRYVPGRNWKILAFVSIIPERSHRKDWLIDSNAESGEGFSDILVEIEESYTGIVIEIKYPDDGDLESGCKKALEQIEEKGYAERLLRDGMKNIVRYGIACYKKTCKVTVLS